MEKFILKFALNLLCSCSLSRFVLSRLSAGRGAETAKPRAGDLGKSGNPRSAEAQKLRAIFDEEEEKLQNGGGMWNPPLALSQAHRIASHRIFRNLRSSEVPLRIYGFEDLEQARFKDCTEC